MDHEQRLELCIGLSRSVSQLGRGPRGLATRAPSLAPLLTRRPLARRRKTQGRGIVDSRNGFRSAIRYWPPKITAR